MDHRILLITTGGTIGGKLAADQQDEQMIRSADQFAMLLGDTIAYLSKKYGLKIEIDTIELCDIDSSDINHEHWIQLAETIRDKYDEYESFIITHGTNTLGYTAAALSFAIANSSKPIILTGSQVPAGLPGTDGLANLQNALRVAIWRQDGQPIKGVVAVFGSHIIAGTRLKKDTEFGYDAFKSFKIGNIGQIGRIIDINENNLKKHVSYLRSGLYPEAKKAKDLHCEIDFDMRIASLTEFPGMRSEIFSILVEKHNIRGIILRAFGAGDPCTKHLEAFKYLKREKIPIVITTQAPNGNSNFQVNEPGKLLLENNLAIPAYDMSIESQTTKLAWLLAKVKKADLGYSELCREMVNDIRGEVKVLWEIGI
ncbi:asparaginase [Acaryochloris marina]|uniref:asparaginase n=1 Tax=Acaryochloris marina TaxID=155978 RepID=UPI001BAF344D|nr:asparaginase [Acaryochloris marina]QUY43495.1 asparaginase [Acaryochloris marina S15]